MGEKNTESKQKGYSVLFGRVYGIDLVAGRGNLEKGFSLVFFGCESGDSKNAYMIPK